MILMGFVPSPKWAETIICQTKEVTNLAFEYNVPITFL